MTYPRQNDIPDRVRNAEEILRVIATLPAPEGLVERVQLRLIAVPSRVTVFRWYGFNRGGWMFSPVLRGCAAAAIVLLVAGGGFAIYSRVQPSPNAKVIEMPARIGNGGAFSTGSAMHTPDTLKGPVLAQPALPAQQNVIAPLPSPHAQTLAPQPRPSAHKKKAAVQ